MTQKEFRGYCLERLGDNAKYYLPILDDYVFATFKSRQLAQELEEEEATVKIAPRLKGKQDSEHSNPKVRMWALYREQANKLGQLLGLIPTSKVGRPSKKKKDFGGGKMKVA